MLSKKLRLNINYIEFKYVKKFINKKDFKLIQKKLDLFKLDPFSLDTKDKDLLFKKYLNDLTRYHYSKSNLYKKI